MVTEHTLFTIVTDTSPCAAQGARHTWPLGSSRTVEEHLAQHQVGWFVTRTPSRPSAAPGWDGRELETAAPEPNWQRGAAAHGEHFVLLHGEQVMMVRCYVRKPFWY